ncbi:MAG TPA: TonB-dependent receptor [Steroidobacteraceae bacterium]|nr:TonB-dependent receptor [Steroidobacteraceae bacterium]
MPAALAAPAAEASVPEVIVGATPLPGSGVDIDKIPGNVQSLDAAELDPGHTSPLLPIAAARRIPSVSLNNEQGSQYQPDFVYRGFEASPISGTAQGLAVYQNGTRINEAFGDSVNWDLVPQFAVSRLTLQSNSPVFGLNALGGAVTLDMKTGFNSPGAEVQVSAGSFGNLTGYAAWGGHEGAFGFYAAAGGVRDEGFRYASPTALRQAYADFGYEVQRTRIHMSLSAANNYLGALGPTPVQLLALNPRAVYTQPQSMRNTMQLLQLNASFGLTANGTLSANAYHRHYQQRLVDGNTTDVQACVNDSGHFCLGGNGLYPGDVLFSQDGQPVPATVLPPAATPGEIDRTATATSSNGAALQYTLTAALGGLESTLTLGAAIDDSTTDYTAAGELGELLPSLQVVGSGYIIDQGLSETAAPPLESPVAVRSGTHYFGAYFSETLSLNTRLALTFSGRFNSAHIDLTDQTGGTLNSSHSYARFNPGVGLSYRVTDTVTGYAGYSQSNRAPTAGELSCADPHSPCLLDAFLVSDPSLRQVVAHTVEAGMRGNQSVAGDSSSVQWNLGIFRTDNHDDIMLLATPTNGFGYFANVGTTRRQGLDAALSFHSGHWQLDLGYSLVAATFRESLTLASNSPAAGPQGEIFVSAGDHIPLTPEHRFTAAVEYSAARWRIGADARYTSTQFLAGDQSNQEAPLPPYTVVNVHGTYQLSATLQLFAAVDNLFDRTYYTYGAFTRLDGLPPNIVLTDPRTYSPDPPRTYYGGIRWSF